MSSDVLRPPLGAKPYYHPTDVSRLVEGIPAGPLGKDAASLTLLRRLVADARDYQPLLQQFNFVQHPSLNAMYSMGRALAYSDEMVLQDLAQHHGPRGVVMAAILTLMRPQRSNIPILESAGYPGRHGTWLVDTAIAEQAGLDSISYKEHQELFRDLRQLISGYRAKYRPLRRAP